MRVIVEFDLVDLSMQKHRDLIKHIYNKYSWAMRECKIIEPEIYDVKKKALEEQDETIKRVCARQKDI